MDLLHQRRAALMEAQEDLVEVYCTQSRSRQEIPSCISTSRKFRWFWTTHRWMFKGELVEVAVQQLLVEIAGNSPGPGGLELDPFIGPGATTHITGSPVDFTLVVEVDQVLVQMEQRLEVLVEEVEQVVEIMQLLQLPELWYNTGGGGGGGAHSGGGPNGASAGGSGIVVIRYKFQ